MHNHNNYHHQNGYNQAIQNNYTMNPAYYPTQYTNQQVQYHNMMQQNMYAQNSTYTYNSLLPKPNNNQNIQQTEQNEQENHSNPANTNVVTRKCICKKT